MGQYCFACWRLSASVVVRNAVSRRACGRTAVAGPAAKRVGCPAAETARRDSGYVPLGQHLVIITEFWCDSVGSTHFSAWQF